MFLAGLGQGTNCLTGSYQCNNTLKGTVMELFVHQTVLGNPTKTIICLIFLWKFGSGQQQYITLVWTSEWLQIFCLSPVIIKIKGFLCLIVQIMNDMALKMQCQEICLPYFFSNLTKLGPLYIYVYIYIYMYVYIHISCFWILNRFRGDIHVKNT